MENEAINKFYKTSYSDSEIAECYEWFEKNMERLPSEVFLVKGTRVKNPAKTAGAMIQHLRKQFHNSGIFCGQFANLLQLRDSILKTENFQEQP